MKNSILEWAVLILAFLGLALSVKLSNVSSNIAQLNVRIAVLEHQTGITQNMAGG